jgi:hypothetical protein
MGWTDGLLGIAFPLLIAIGFAVGSIGNATAGEFLVTRLLFIAAALDIAGLTLYWLWKSDLGSVLQFGLAALSGAVILTSLLAGFLWVDRRQYPRPQIASTTTTTPTLKKPSFVFVFGVPLGDNRSATWLMMLLHFGPDAAYNCNVDFSDDDRKNIEHLWHIKHPNLPFLPKGQFDESHKRLYVAEAGAEDGTRQNFTWTPLNPNSQHYTVGISCRDGAFVEKWEITRVNGVLRAKIVIERGPGWIRNHPEESPIVFMCEDPEFVGTSLATAISSRQSGVVTHPGWKPNHRFEVPVAIIDPNGRLQVASSIGQPDGNMRTDFGCWNILTKHMGG